MIQPLRDEFQSLKPRVQLKCHANYEWICATSSVYKESVTKWERVKAHLKGTWNDFNKSLEFENYFERS